MSKPILETGRLRLFEFDPDNAADADFNLRLLNSEGFIRHIADRGVRTPQQSRDYLRERIVAAYAKHGYGMWRVALEDGTSIGSCGLVRRDGLDGPDLGYAFLPEYGGHGYAREAARGCVDFARNALEIPRLLAIVNPDNPLSIRLLRDSGFEFDKMLSLPGIDHELQLFRLELN